MNALEQRRSALAKGTRRRVFAAQFKRGLREMPRWRAAEFVAVEVGRGFPDAPGTPIGPLLLAIPLFGEKKLAKLLKELGLDARRTVGSLSDRRRLELALRLRAFAREWEGATPRLGQSERSAAA